MVPNVFNFFGYKVPLYGVMVSLGIIAFVITTFIILEKIEKLPQKICNRLYLISGVGLIILAVSAFIFNSIFHSIEEGKIVIGGITWLGGVVGVFIVMPILIHKFIPGSKGNELYYLSLLMPGIIIGHSLGRVGCFFGGCCYGQVTDSIFGVIYPFGSLAAQKFPGLDGRSLPVLPTQLFEACFELLLYVFLLINHKRFKKYNVEIYAIVYSIFRFILEFFRADDRGSTFTIVSPAQFLSIILIVCGILTILTRKNIIFHKIYNKLEQWKNEPQDNLTNEIANPISLLEELARLNKENIITDEEFENKKKDILSRL